MKKNYFIVLIIHIIFLHFLLYCSCSNDGDQEFGHPGNVTALNTGAVNSWYPSMVWNGFEYGVAWQDSRSGDMQVYFMRFNESGNLIAAIYGTTMPGDSQDPCLIWGDDNYFIAWSDSLAGNYQTYFYRIEDVNWAQIYISPSNSSGENPRAAPAGSAFGVAWEDKRDGAGVQIYMVITDSSGGNSGDIRITDTTGNSLKPSIVWTGSEFALAWMDSRDGNEEIYFAYINGKGKKLTGDIRITNTPENSQWPSLVWNGTVCALVWIENGGDIYFAN